jgi:cell division protein FtsI/penicillin-binding protein 2/cell division protein FtsW (lipid II flippase)
MLSVERGGPGRPRPPTRQVDLRRPHVDVVALAATAVLVLLGLLNLDALGEHARAQHQAFVVLVGVALFLVLSRFRSASLPWLGWACYVSSVVMLAVVELAGVTAYGAQRWLDLGPISLQPSELAKLGLVLVLAHVLNLDLSWPRRLALALGLAAVPIGLVFLEPDLSTAIVLAALTVALLVLGRVPWRAVVGMVAAVAVSVPFAAHLLQPYQLARITAFLDRSDSAEGPGWSILQAHIAVAWGGLTGQSRQPLRALFAAYLPKRETDLAFASLVQQWGIVAGTLAVLAAAVLVWRVAGASRHARTRTAALSAAGFAALIGIEVVVSVATNLGLIPTAGVPFPLLGYGGTTAVVHLGALGIVLATRAEADRHALWLSAAWRRIHPRMVRLAALTVCLALVAMIGFTWHLQQTSGPQLRQAGLDQMTRCVRIPAPRGVITDRHGARLAVNLAQEEVWVVPALLDGAARTRLAALVARPRAVVDRIVARHRTSLTVKLATLPVAAGARVAAARLHGVVVVPSTRRHYPYGPLLGPVLGWSGIATPEDERRWPGLPSGEIVGRAGIEQTYDPILRGVNGRVCVYVSPAGVPVAMGPRVAPIRGATLRLSLDLSLQRQLTANLATALRGFPGEPRGDIGGAVVLNPRNGQVLAMASLPSYDNNVFGPPIDQAPLARLYAARGHPMLNKVTQVAAPPGSTFKLVVAAADMVHPVFPPDLVIPTGGAWTLGDHTFHNWTAMPPHDLVQAIAWSNDVYFYKLAWALGPDPIIDTARRLGVGSPTGIDLPGEVAGYLGSPSTVGRIGATWYPGSTVILGIGQGYITTTPLQNALWTAGIATGSMVTPHLGLAFESSPRHFTRLDWPAPRRLRFAARLGPVRAGMAAAATSGTASILRALPVSAGAKTGSSEDPSSPNGAPDSWFSATAPLPLPNVAATSFVRGGGHGVSTSGHVVLPTLLYFFEHQASVLATEPAASQ